MSFSFDNVLSAWNLSTKSNASQNISDGMLNEDILSTSTDLNDCFDVNFYKKVLQTIATNYEYTGDLNNDNDVLTFLTGGNTPPLKNEDVEYIKNNFKEVIRVYNNGKLTPKSDKFLNSYIFDFCRAKEPKDYKGLQKELLKYILAADGSDTSGDVDELEKRLYEFRQNNQHPIFTEEDVVYFRQNWGPVIRAWIKRQSDPPFEYTTDLTLPEVSYLGWEVTFKVDKDLLNEMMNYPNVKKEDIDAISWSTQSGSGEWNVVKPRASQQGFELKVKNIKTDRWMKPKLKGDPQKEGPKVTITFKTNDFKNEK